MSQSKSTSSISWRFLWIWLLIIGAETVHGVLRGLFLAPLIGDFPARQVSVFIGSGIIFLVVWFTFSWIQNSSRSQLLFIGLLWVLLTVAFEVSLGKFVLNLSWSRILEDYDLSGGGLMGFGLLFLFMSPSLVALLCGLSRRA